MTQTGGRKTNQAGAGSTLTLQIPKDFCTSGAGWKHLFNGGISSLLEELLEDEGLPEQGFQAIIKRLFALPDKAAEIEPVAGIGMTIISLAHLFRCNSKLSLPKGMLVAGKPWSMEPGTGRFLWPAVQILQGKAQPYALRFLPDALEEISKANGMGVIISA